MKRLLFVLAMVAMVVSAALPAAAQERTASGNEATNNASNNALHADVATTDVFCDTGTFNRCTNTLIIADATHTFTCRLLLPPYQQHSEVVGK